jgi:hypothetical protein
MMVLVGQQQHEHYAYTQAIIPVSGEQYIDSLLRQRNNYMLIAGNPRKLSLAPPPS